MNRQNWICPFCKHASTIGEADIDLISGENLTDSNDGRKSLRAKFIVCPNPECKKLSLNITLYKTEFTSGGTRIAPKKRTHFWQLIPDSAAQVYSTKIVPQAIIDDYQEACKILNLSPKASATLARRAIQGMIRDFWKIKKPQDYKGMWSLKNEIEAIEGLVDPDVWTAIDAVRDVGNIGAHMEQDVNIIINVEQEEAEQLIGLIELLIEEWYVNSHERKLRLDAIKKMAEQKKEQKLASKISSTDSSIS
jgi:hypothetical protein